MGSVTLSKSLQIKFNYLASVISNWHPSLLIFVLACINFLQYDIYTNEEVYLSLAKQWANPQWQPHSFYLNDVTANRWLFQCITSIFFSHLSFELIAYIGKILCYAGLAWPLGLILKKIGLSNLWIFVLFQLLYFNHQYFFAGEWLFGGVESKVLAYWFVFGAIYALLNGKKNQTIICIAIATYFHVIVGGWFAIGYVIYCLIFDRQLKNLLGITIYAVLILPLIYHLSSLLIARDISNEELSAINHTIIYVRNPHHIGIWKDLSYFLHNHLLGVLYTLSSVLLSLYVAFTKKDQAALTLLAKLNIAIALLISTMVFITYFDKQGKILLYYPFRLSALNCLLSFLLITCLLAQEFEHLKKHKTAIVLAILIGFPLMVHRTALHVGSFLNENNAFNDFCAYVKTHTKPQDQFIFLGFEYEEEWQSFIRKAERDPYFNNKFCPVERWRMKQWMLRKENYNQVKYDLVKLKQLATTEPIDYAVSKDRITEMDSLFVHNNSIYYLYDLKP